MKAKSISFIFISSIIVSTSCKKDVPDATIENSYISIEFHSPIKGETWYKGSESHIEAIINADAMMGGWRSLILNKDRSDTIERYSDFYEQTQYLVHHHWIPDFNSPDTLMIVVQALDKLGTVLKEDSTMVLCS